MPDKVKSNKHKIIIVDDHPMIRDGLSTLLKQSEEFNVAGTAEDSEEAVNLILKTRPKIAIVDLSLKTTSGLDLIRALKTRFPSMQILVYSMYDEAMYAERAIRAGASGYVMKVEPSGVVIDALREIVKGEYYLSSRLSKNILHKILGVRKDNISNPVELFTDRELEIFTLMGQGFSTKQISAKVNLTRSTIDTHKKNIKTKLNVKNTNDILRYAIEWLHENKIS